MGPNLRQITMPNLLSGSWRTVPLGAWVVFISFGLLFSIRLNALVGGSITRILLMCFGLFILKGRHGDVSFSTALVRSFRENMGCMSLLAIYYAWIVVGCMRVGSFSVSFGENVMFMWKYYLNEGAALAAGVLLLHNPRYRRWAIYVAAFFMLIHAILALKYVAFTGVDIREVGGETGGVFGATEFWQPFAMVTLLFLGCLLSETRKWIKIIGFCCLPLLYRAILFCGYATPVALFLIGHIVVGILCVTFGGKRRFVSFFTMVVSVVMIIGVYLAVVKIANSEQDDDRTANIQFRFKNMLENPEGGGYDIENSRLQWMRVGWESFKKSPITGAGGMYLMNPACAGHHALVDYLGVYGLIGGGSYILFVLLCIRNTMHRYRLDRTWENAAMVGGAIMYLVGGIFNPCWYGNPTVVFFFYAFPFWRKNEENRFYRFIPMVENWRT